MKDNKASYWHSENMLCSNGYNFYIKDKAHQNQSSRGFLNTQFYEAPKNEDFDENTYLAGSEYFKLKEINVYRVIRQ